MHHDEIWQLYYPNGEPIPGVGWESARDNPECSGSDEIVGVAVIFLYRVKDGVLEVLWQKRAETVDRFPGYYDISAGGHINLGESLVEAAIRETYEEIGAKISAEDLYFVTMRPFYKNRFAWVFCVDYFDRPDDFKFNDHEVSEVKWVPYDELNNFWHTEAKPPLQKDHLTYDCLTDWLKMHGYL
ncbi:NUDIX domain-containing protein [Candidatus Saccharibacteria bacterium]|nr:NUDIX domain-containing protein [Candidatus Saccharibacteria bacterium]